MKNQKFLHIGCGNTILPKPFLNIDGRDLEGVDLVCDLEELPFDDCDFDLIYCSHVLEHFKRNQIETVLSEWFRCLKKGGIFRISVPDFSALTKIYAVDNDPQAITATIDNSLKNRLDKDTITTYLPEALPEIKADILLANILATPLIDLAEHFSGKLRPGGHIVLSGILRDQTTLICDHYEKWFSIEKSIIEQDWALLTGTRKT